MTSIDGALLYGYLSGANTTFTNIADGSVAYYNFTGMASGRNATVECVGKCVIECHVNACNHLKTVCSSVCPNCTIYVICDDAEESNFCTKNDSIHVVTVPDYVYDYNHTDSHSVLDVNDLDGCNTTSSINAGAYQEYYQTANLSVVNGSICATGMYQ